MSKIRMISVIGAGQMGNGIAQVSAQAGYQVTMRDVDQTYLQRGVDAIRKSLEILSSKGKIGPEGVEAIIGRIKITTDLGESVKDADLVIEAIPEDMKLKKDLFMTLDKICKAETILATNTSSLSITAIASATSRPDKVIGMHFALPVPLQMIVELIKGRDTSDETLVSAKDVVNTMGKEYIMAADFPGFAANRLMPLYVNEAFYCVWQGVCSFEDMDKMARVGLKHPLGPFELADLVGLDTILAILEYLSSEVDDKYRPCPLLKQIVAAGHLGRKSGRGVYKYT
jgi:3-hydroxybutyryl-CoA dehydrogenase